MSYTRNSLKEGYVGDYTGIVIDVVEGAHYEFRLKPVWDMHFVQANMEAHISIYHGFASSTPYTTPCRFPLNKPSWRQGGGGSRRTHGYTDRGKVGLKVYVRR